MTSMPGCIPKTANSSLRPLRPRLIRCSAPFYDVEYRTIGKEDGVTRWVAAKGRGLFDADGKCVRVIGSALDITQRKLSEERFQRQQASFRELVERAPYGIYVIDQDLRIDSMNVGSQN